MSCAASSGKWCAQSASRGFTLLEVLVALVIVTVGMGALLSALSSSAESTGYLRDKTFAEWVALNHLEEVRLALQRPKKGKTDGETEMAGRDWTWSQEVLETEVKGILRVDVSVRPKDAPGDKNTTWYTTVSAIVGDALAAPRGDMDAYAASMQTGTGGTQNPGGTLGGTLGGQQPGNNGQPIVRPIGQPTQPEPPPDQPTLPGPTNPTD
jgi:general secretion pathway protein I